MNLNPIEIVDIEVVVDCFSVDKNMNGTTVFKVNHDTAHISIGLNSNSVGLSHRTTDSTSIVFDRSSMEINDVGINEPIVAQKCTDSSPAQRRQRPFIAAATLQESIPPSIAHNLVS